MRRRLAPIASLIAALAVVSGCASSATTSTTTSTREPSEPSGSGARSDDGTQAGDDEAAPPATAACDPREERAEPSLHEGPIDDFPRAISWTTDRAGREAAERAERAPSDVAAPPASATRTASGLASQVLRRGTGRAHPRDRDRVTVRYAGWTTDGQLAFSNHLAPPDTFPQRGVIPGWAEGISLMVVGEQRRLWIPEALAYRGRAGKPAGMLVVDVEVLGIEEGPAVPDAPVDVASAPSDATRTASGLASRVLEAGTGTTHPSAAALVSVAYSAWTTDGRLVASSVPWGSPARLSLCQTVPGLAEGIQLMVEGERRRFWVPAVLGYGAHTGFPEEALVFDVELLAISP